jgi:hypothetical protein
MDELRAAQPAANRPDDGQIPYHQAYFGCCSRTVMTRQDIAQPKFCPFCGKAIYDGSITEDHYRKQPVPAEGAQAWLIERPGPEWATCWSGGFEWTKDSLKAIRFCRREDANQVAELFEFEDVRITEHTWE